MPCSLGGQLARHVVKTKGLEGDQLADDNKVLGKVTDPALQARYKEQEQQRAEYKKQPKPLTP